MMGWLSWRIERSDVRVARIVLSWCYWDRGVGMYALLNLFLLYSSMSISESS